MLDNSKPLSTAHRANTATAPPAQRPLLLIHNLYNYGHFLVYADTLTVWALARGFRVALMGRGLEGTFYQRRHQNDPNVELLDMGPGERLGQDLASLTKTELTARACAELCRVQAERKPEASILLSTDEFLFHSTSVLDPNFAFPTPTVGVVTFGHRDCRLGFKDLYARNLDAVLARRHPFRAVLTLDEYQVAAVDPGEEHLVFLPDIYADPPRPKAAGHIEREQAETAELEAFLGRARGPVLPVLGKIDQRKNPLWVLRAVSQTPNACCVLLGQRVPSPDDPAIDALLAELEAQNRVFLRTDYVPESLFRTVLGHPAVPFLPLPYACHYGSSGLQLQALAAGKPTLVPNVGLMAWRVRAHGLGQCHRHGDEADFRRAWDRLLEQGAAPYAEPLARFMANFTPEARNAQLDKAFGLAGASATPQSPLVKTAARTEPLGSDAQALILLHAGRAEAALKIFDAALGSTPTASACLWGKALALHALGRHREAGEVALRCAASSGHILPAFQINLCCDALTGARTEAEQGEALEMLCLLLRLVPAANTGKNKEHDKAGNTPEHPLAALLRTRWQSPDIDAFLWHRLGGVLARLGLLAASALGFGRALELDPLAHDYRLNLSDVLRYAKRYDDAAAALDALAAKAPEHPGLHHKRGQVLFERGELVRARAEFLLEPKNSPHRQAAEVYVHKCPPEAKG